MIRQRNLNGSNESIGLRYDMYAVGRLINLALALAWLWLVWKAGWWSSREGRAAYNYIRVQYII